MLYKLLRSCSSYNVFRHQLLETNPVRFKHAHLHSPRQSKLARRATTLLHARPVTSSLLIALTISNLATTNPAHGLTGFGGDNDGSKVVVRIDCGGGDSTTYELTYKTSDDNADPGDPHHGNSSCTPTTFVYADDRAIGDHNTPATLTLKNSENKAFDADQFDVVLAGDGLGETTLTVNRLDRSSNYEGTTELAGTACALNIFLEDVQAKNCTGGKPPIPPQRPGGSDGDGDRPVCDLPGTDNGGSGTQDDGWASPPTGKGPRPKPTPDPCEGCGFYTYCKHDRTFNIFTMYGQCSKGLKGDECPSHCCDS